MLLEGIVSLKCRLMHVQIYALMKKQKENSHEGITWSEMGKQNVQAEKVYSNTPCDAVMNGIQAKLGISLSSRCWWQSEVRKKTTSHPFLVSFGILRDALSYHKGSQLAHSY